MKRKALLAMSLFLAFVLIGMVGSSATQDKGPEYSLEGAWYGFCTVVGLGQFQTLENFTSDAQRQGREGTFLSTSQARFKMPNPTDPTNPNKWTGMTVSGHGNWVRIDKNKYAYTDMRIVYDQDAAPFGWTKFWGTITPISDNEITATGNYQFYYLDGTPYWPMRTTTLHWYRVPITLE